MRPREVTDEALLAAAIAVVSQRGPAAFTLAEVGRAAGLTQGAVSHRFGSKRGLLLAIARAGPAEVARTFEAARKAHPGSRLEALEAALTGAAGFAGSAEEVANGLQFLQLDLTDPAFRALTRAHFRAIRDGLEQLLAEAVDAGELQPADPEALARTLEACYHGAILAWAADPEGSAPDAVRRAVRVVLDPRRA